jgi:DNA-binding transcriptional LysR family regulator
MLPDLDSLALFVRAGEMHSLTKAAEASHIGLAAASRRIALLEHKFRTTLLERSPKGVELTPAGHALMAHAKKVLMQMNQLQVDMSDYAAGRKGALRLMANTSVMTEELPNHLALFLNQHPDVRLVIEERWSREVARAVLASEADIGIVLEGSQIDGLDVFPYVSDQLSVVLPKDHPLSKKPSVFFSDILEYEVVALEAGSSMMRLLAQQAVVAEQPLRLRIQVRSFEAVCRMVQSGLGIGVLPILAAKSLANAMGLTVKPLNDEWAVRLMLVCIKKDRQPNPSLMPLVEFLVAQTPRRR